MRLILEHLRNEYALACKRSVTKRPEGNENLGTCWTGETG